MTTTLFPKCWLPLLHILSLFIIKRLNGVESHGTPRTSIRRRAQESITVEVYIRFDDFPSEIGWSIFNTATLKTAANYPIGTYSLSQREISQTVALLPGESYLFTISDGSGNGMSNPSTGFFFIQQGNVILVEADGDFGSFQSIPFTTMMSETNTAVSPSTSSSTPVEIMTLAPSADLETSAPTVSVLVNVTVELTFDSFPIDIGWSIVDTDTNETILHMPIGIYGSSMENVSEQVILSSGQSYTFSIFDSQEDQSCCVEVGTYVIQQEGIILVNGAGTDFQTMRSVSFTPYYPPPEDTQLSATPTSYPTSTPSLRASVSPTGHASTWHPSQSSVGWTRNVEVIVHIAFDSFPEETGWSIATTDGLTIVEVPAGTYKFSQTESFEMALLSAGESYSFTIIDSFADGMGGGSFEVLQDGVRLLSGTGNSFLSSTTISFTTLVDTGLPMPSASPITNTSPIVSWNGENVTTQWPGGDGLAIVTFELIFDSFPEEISWTLLNSASEEIAFDSYTASADNVKRMFELEAGMTYTFIIRDSAGDGLCCSGGEFIWVQQDVQLVKGGGNFGAESSFSFTTLVENFGPTSSPLTNITTAPSSAPTFNATLNATEPVDVKIVIVFDTFPDEIGWSIVDESSGEEIISIPVGSYLPTTEVGTELLGLIPEIVYRFTIVDTFGDGLTGRGISTFGSYLILQDTNGDSLTLLTGDPDFGYNTTMTFSPMIF